MNFIIVLLIGFSSWLWPTHLSDWGCEEGKFTPYGGDGDTYVQVPAGVPVDMLLTNPPWAKVGALGEFDGTVWTRVNVDMVLNSPMYAEHCTPLFNAPDEYRWHCTGKWKVPGPCRHHKDEDGLIHTTCVQCYVKNKEGLYDRMKCPVMDVDELLEMTGQKMEADK